MGYLRVLLFLSLLCVSAWAAGLADSPSSLLMRVLDKPYEARVDGKTVVCYELALTNLQQEPCRLNGLQCLDGEKVLQQLETSELQGRLMALDRGDRNIDDATLHPGQTAVLFLWLEGVSPNASLHHRLSMTWADRSATIDGAETGIDRQPLVNIGFPFKKAGQWVAINGPSNTSVHRRSPIPLEGKVNISQRFAIDWMLLGAANRVWNGDGKTNEQYYCFGQEAVAVADGEVVGTYDKVPLNDPSSSATAVPITLKTVGGNWVALKIGDERYAMYAHLIPGSLKVKEGDRVKKGQTLGLIGNTGSSTGPHLHFHVATSPQWLIADGVPYVLETFTSVGSVGDLDQAPPDGSLDVRSHTPTVRSHAMPAENEIVLVP